MKILLTGTSGFIGGHIRQRLIDAGHDVIAIDRHHGFNFNQMSNPKDWLTLLEGIDAVINSVGIIIETSRQSFETLHHLAPAALFSACAQAQIKTVIQISALGADEQAFTPYQISKYAADQVLRSLPVNGFILRPSLVYGEGGKSLTLFRRLAAFPVLPLADGGRQQIQPVHISDLVTCVQRCLDSKETGRTLNIVGPQVYSFAQWLNLIRQKQGKRPARILPIPFKSVLAIASLGRHILPVLHPDNLRMLQRGNTADVQPLVELLGHAPAHAEDKL
jgi:uncharacterized protein YbjT (DUF2867 family)